MATEQLLKAASDYGKEFCDFLNESYSVFHVSSNIQKRLQAKNFIHLEENANWALEAGKKYYFQRNNTTVVAFTIGKNFDINNTGFKIVASHIDSPCLQLAPVSKLQQYEFNQACIQTYGGGLWSTWFDRDLNIGGRIIYKDTATGSYKSTVWNSSKPFTKIMNLAIHLQNYQERHAFSVNTETELRPIFSTEGYEKLLAADSTTSSNHNNKTDSKENKQNVNNTINSFKIPCDEKHYEKLINDICADLTIQKSQIVDLELQLADSNKAQIIGIFDEFISGGKVDDLICTFAGLKTLEENTTDGKKFIDMVVFYDHEEIGSQSAYGAKSTLLNETCEKIYKVLQNDDNLIGYEKAKASSFIISTDVNHAVHPNYLEKYQIDHYCYQNKGLVIPFDPGQNFASSSATRSIIYELAKKNNVPIQDFINKNNINGGSTLGPYLASMTGMRTVDVGPALLAMHSIRETGGVLDAYYMYQLDQGFFGGGALAKK